MKKKIDFSPVHLRTKKIAQGRESIFLDIVKDGVRRKEYLGLYLVPEKTRGDKVANRATMKTAVPKHNYSDKNKCLFCCMALCAKTKVTNRAEFQARNPALSFTGSKSFTRQQ